TQPDPLTYHPVANVLQDFAYEYDLAGNILHLHDRTPESGIPNTLLGTEALDRDFVYDAIYRLRSANGRECDLPPDFPWDDAPRATDLIRSRAYAETYQYDKVGNIVQLQHGANRDFTLVSGSNRLGSVTSGQRMFNYAYDLNGNLLQETNSRHFEWDHLDRMRVYRTQAGTAEPSVHTHYLYNSGGQRVKKLVRKQGGQVEVSVYLDQLFEPQHVVQGPSSLENSTLHVMDNQSRIALLRVGKAFPDASTPSVKYQLADHLGSSNIVIGGADERADGFVNREEYTPYGETSFASFARKRYRFSGKEKDQESGFCYFGARYFAPWIARWTTCDPKGPIDSLNLYLFTRNNPIRYVDRNGNECKPDVACCKTPEIIGSAYRNGNQAFILSGDVPKDDFSNVREPKKSPQGPQTESPSAASNMGTKMTIAQKREEEWRAGKAGMWNAAVGIAEQGLRLPMPSLSLDWAKIAPPAAANDPVRNLVLRESYESGGYFIDAASFALTLSPTSEMRQGLRL